MTCQELVNRGTYRGPIYRPCGRAVKDEGLCGLHLSVKRRREANDQAMNEKFDRAEQLKQEAKRLSAALGVSVEPDYNPFSRGGGNYTGDFVVSGDWLRSLAGENSA